jgi:hypothetical protein
MRRSLLALFLTACGTSNTGSDEFEGGESGVTDSSDEESSSSESESTSTDTESSSSESESSSTDTESSSTDTESSSTTGEPGASLGVFDLTYYWVAFEGDYAGAPDTNVGSCGGMVLATVPQAFADALKLEGTGKLLDDRILNIAGCGCGGGYDCFAELDPMEFPWGRGSQGNALVPFSTIATDTGVLPFGTSVYAPSLEGQALPGGGTHDGCLRAGDVGGGIDGMHIDWFVGLKDNYSTLDPDVPETIELFEGGTLCP